jgi:hypothetical protein
MHAAREEQSRGGFGGWLRALPGRPVGLAAAAAVVAIIAIVGLGTGLFDFGASSTSAQVQGVVARVDPDAIVITTADGQVVIRLADGTLVFDASGQAISGGEIVPGRSARVEFEEEDDGSFSGLKVEVEEHEDEGAEVEFTGVLRTVGSSAVTVDASFGTVTVRLDASTEIEGALAPGARVEVEAVVDGSGGYLAKEIKVEGGGSGPGSAGDDDGGGDDGGGDDTPTPSSGSGDGSGEDDHSGTGSSGSGDGHDEKPEDEHESEDEHD